MTYNCRSCGKEQHVFITDVQDEICLTCFYKNRKLKEEQDFSEARDLVENTNNQYENSQCASQTGEISYEFGVNN